MFTEMLLYFYVGSFLFGPAVLGFLAGRFFHPFIRYLFVLWIAITGYACCKYSAHGFLEAIVPGNFTYVLFFSLGFYLRQKKRKDKFVIYQILDGLLVLFITMVCMYLYERPTA